MGIGEDRMEMVGNGGGRGRGERIQGYVFSLITCFHSSLTHLKSNNLCSSLIDKITN